MAKHLENTMDFMSAVKTLTQHVDDGNALAAWEAWKGLKHDGGKLVHKSKDVPSALHERFSGLKQELQKANNPVDFMNIYMEHRSHAEEIWSELSTIKSIAQGVIRDIKDIGTHLKPAFKKLVHDFKEAHKEFMDDLHEAHGMHKVAAFFKDGLEAGAHDVKAIHDFNMAVLGLTKDADMDALLQLANTQFTVDDNVAAANAVVAKDVANDALPYEAEQAAAEVIVEDAALEMPIAVNNEL